MFEDFFKLLYPNKCAVCGKILIDEYACKNCQKNIKYMWKDKTIKLVKGKEFDYLFSSFHYEKIIRDLLLKFKFYNKKYLYKFFSERIIDTLKNTSDIQIDIVSYVPISLIRYFERGYNQSYLIAKEISKELNIPIAKYGIIKIKNNKRQSDLTYAERLTNAKNVYKVSNKDVFRDKCVLLVDDIYTTGTTVNECSKVIKRAGAAKVIVVTIARKWRTEELGGF